MKKITINDKTKKIIGLCVCVLFCIVLAAVSFTGGWFVHQKTISKYTIEAVVTDVIVDTGSVYFTTPAGHTFVIVTDEIFATNENYTLTFNTNSTPTVEDDKIIKVTRDISIY